MTADSTDTLRTRHAQLLETEPKLRIRDRARRLGVTEAELVAADCGLASTALAGTAQEIFSGLAALRAHWLALQDTHDFFLMLRQFQVSRLGALRAAGDDLAQQVEADAVEKMLTQAAATQLPIMCFVANRGIVQIHTGPVKKLLRTGPWFNVLDESFNLHLNTEAVTSSWVVSKPTVDGWVTSLELYNADGELIVQFFGARKPGQAELSAWRELLLSLCPQPQAA